MKQTNLLLNLLEFHGKFEEDKMHFNKICEVKKIIYTEIENHLKERK